MPTATVREALLFSAHLRLPSTVDAATRSKFVDNVLSLLELSPIAGRTVATLGKGELKRLTVGVELAANTPLLFADEPTSGLDSRSAAVVMRVLRKVRNADSLCAGVSDSRWEFEYTSICTAFN